MAGRHSAEREWITEDNLLRIKGWARDGLTDKMIAKSKIGIAERTFTDWKKRQPAISAALKEGRAPIDVEIEDSMAKSAKGFMVKEKKPFKVKTVKRKDGMELSEEHIEVVEVERFIEPKVAAQIYWLKNRKPNNWKDKQVQDITDDITKISETLIKIRQVANNQND